MKDAMAKCGSMLHERCDQFLWIVCASSAVPSLQSGQSGHQMTGRGGKNRAEGRLAAIIPVGRYGIVVGGVLGMRG